MTEIREYCKRIAEELEAVAEGKMYRCAVCGELIRADALEAECPDCAGELEQIGMLDYFEDALDVEYSIGGSGREYRSVCVMVACGGPNVYVNTGTKKVELYWGTDREDFGLSQSVIATIDDAFEELYNC